ncbi:ATP-binding protein [Cellulomonas aerilata]|uniref:Histidine kinase/HSP90-like ATPase domain-containing protein n=1 Tax=Cellulomonas aerilata TaxID=515326 RepID=A0A512DFF4_9CELL|nr:ATP-binding protein [Cellulomonas aerilata]GEO35229.1 hypothetical protein CAE01nite_29540 [Cellulomonas aerilata]
MSLAISARTELVREGRRWVTAQAVRCGASPAALATITLLSSELVANAVLHGPADGAIVVRARAAGPVFRVEVDDDGHASPRVRHAAPGDAGGRGMFLVDARAARWGCYQRSPSGKTVWFEARM